MTALKAHEVDRYLNSKSLARSCFLIYGNDSGLVRERARNIVKNFTSRSGGEMELISLQASELDSEPDRLGRETRTQSLFGGAPIVRLHGTANKHAKILAELLEDWPDCVLVLESDNLTPRDKLRATVEKSKSGVAIPCFADSAKDLIPLINDTFSKAGIAITPRAATLLREQLGNDREVTRRELEKLILFAHETKRIDEEDIIALSGDNSTIAVDQIIDAVGTGHLPQLESALAKARIASIDSGRILRATLNHFIMLQNLAAKAAENGQRAADLVDPGRLRFHFSREVSIKTQARLWSDENLVRAIDQIQLASLKDRESKYLGQAITERVLISLASRISKI